MSSPERPRHGWAESTSLEALRDVIARGASIHRLVARRAGLSDHELVALERLGAGALGPAEIAEILDVTRPAATGIVDRLEARGHVERRAHAGDRRRTEVVVTDSGRGEVRAHLLPMFLKLAELDASFSEAERDVVARYLTGALAALDAVAVSPEPEGHGGDGG